jgi:hypothetical protein
MSIFFLLITAVVVVIFALVIVFVFRGMARSAQKVRDNYARAIPATAKVLRVGESNNAQDYDTVDVTLTFEVNPPSGAPYHVKTTWSVDPASVAKIQAGNTVAIRIGSDDRRKIYSAEPWAQSLELMQNSIDESEE